MQAWKGSRKYCNCYSILTNVDHGFVSRYNVPSIFQYFGPWMKYYPLGRMGKIKDVAPVIVFLASKNADFVTGINLPIDGGYSATPKIMGVN